MKCEIKLLESMLKYSIIRDPLSGIVGFIIAEIFWIIVLLCLLNIKVTPMLNFVLMFSIVICAIIFLYCFLYYLCKTKQYKIWDLHKQEND
jgi:purine-cytosine permease-like protein